MAELIEANFCRILSKGLANCMTMLFLFGYPRIFTSQILGIKYSEQLRVLATMLFSQTSGWLFYVPRHLKYLKT